MSTSTTKNLHNTSTSTSTRDCSESDAVKFIVVSGGVMSGLGKGITASSLGLLLKRCGFSITAIKVDPYLNCDAGTMSPFEHGECYVLDDGGETDLDLGNYERFIDINLTKAHSITTGNIYRHVLERERRGDYLGKTVQVVPHITDHIVERLLSAAQLPVDSQGTTPDICIIELGGTVGDIESRIFIEALRQLKQRCGSNMTTVHVSLVPCVESEQKTKPTQHSCTVLSTHGVHADFIACRCQRPLLDSTKRKIAAACNVHPDHVLSLHNATDIWKVPEIMRGQNVCEKIGHKLGLYIPHGKPDMSSWTKMVQLLDTSQSEVSIGIVAKYLNNNDTYLSLIRSLQHAAVQTKRKLRIVWIDAEKLEDDKSYSVFSDVDGILVPGGFGTRGVNGKLLAIEYARVNGVPFLGICLGMQLAVIESARNKLHWDSATSEEFISDTKMDAQSTTECNKSDSRPPVIVFMPEGSTTHFGGTMRVGSRQTRIQTKECISAGLYCPDHTVHERHRHRYEVNPNLIKELESTESGLRFVGKDADTGNRMEIVERSTSEHPFFVGCQFHPEYKSRPNRPAPLIYGFILAACAADKTAMKKKGGSLSKE